MFILATSRSPTNVSLMDFFLKSINPQGKREWEREQEQTREVENLEIRRCMDEWYLT